jgi:Flp pilus assembly protein TadG
MRCDDKLSGHYGWRYVLRAVNSRPTRRESRQGYVLLTMSAAAFALFGALGLSVDVGRLFIAKTETQAFSDSAALGAALLLDGTSVGIAAAQNAVSNNVNTSNLDSTKITNYTLDFATSSAGPWSTNPTPATGYIYARVQANAPVNLYFISVVVPQQVQTVKASSIAGQIAYTGNFPQGLGPFSAVGPDPTDPNFGLVPGQQYDIQWPAYNGSRGGCSPSTPANCFVKPTCSGESTAAMTEVVTEWGASVNGYWGDNANHTIDQEVLDLTQLQAVSVGTDIPMTAGNKNAEATALDTRVNEDGNLTDNTPSAYLASSTKNLRRLIALPILTPTVVDGNTDGYVLGYGSFLLMSNGSPSNYYASGNGNDPFCAVYVGGYTQGGTNGGGSAGYFKVKLVQ